MFVQALEKMFTGFDVGADTKIIESLTKRGEKNVFIVKKSKYYITLFSAGTILLIFFVAIVNIMLIFFTNILPELFKIILSLLLGINLFTRAFTSISYLRLYSKNYGIFKIMSARERIPVLKKGDKSFRSFFDRTIWLMLSYILIVVFFLVGAFFLVEQMDTVSAILISLNVILFIFQFFRIIKLLKKFINLEMDFVIVTKEHVKHYNQEKLGVKTKTLDVEKIKTVKGNKLGGLRSFLNFGEVSIMTEGDTSDAQADMHLKYIVRPEKVEGLLNELRND